MEIKNKKNNSSHTKVKILQLKKQKMKTLHPKINSKLEQEFNFYSIFNKNTDKYFVSVEKSIPRYLQAFTEIQHEYLKLFENIFKSSISFQKKIFRNFKMDTEEFNGVSKFISDTTEDVIRTKETRDESVLSSMESFKDIIFEWDTMFQSYSDTYSKIFQSRG